MSTINDNPTQDRTVRVGYLVSGLVFLGLAISWALWAGGAVGGPALGFLVPAVLVVAGGVGILALLLTAAQRRRVAGRTTRYDEAALVEAPHAQHDTYTDTENDTKEIR